MKEKRFEEYFLQYKNLVMRVVISKTGDYQTAQEICQQVFISFYTNMDRISSGFVKAWLMCCTQNAVVDHIRKNKGRECMAPDAPVSEKGNILAEESIGLLEERLSDRELIGRIFREVKAVNGQWYEILMLYCVEGMSYAEAAEKLDVPEEVLRARMYRARLFIKERFGKEYLDRK